MLIRMVGLAPDAGGGVQACPLPRWRSPTSLPPVPSVARCRVGRVMAEERGNAVAVLRCALVVGSRQSLQRVQTSEHTMDGARR